MSDRQSSDRVTRFRNANQNTIQELASRILDNLSANLGEAAVATRGRSSTRPGTQRSGPGRSTPRPGQTRSLLFHSCSCGPVCTSARASTACASALNPEASTFVPRIREGSRNVAKRSKPRRVSFGPVRPVTHHPGGPSSGLVEEPRGASPPLFPSSYYQAVGEGPSEPSSSSARTRGFDKAKSSPPPPLEETLRVEA